MNLFQDQGRYIFLLRWLQDKSGRSTSSTSGFSLVELMTVLVIVGLLAGGTIGWLSFWNARKLTAAQDEVFQAVRQAQDAALRTHSSWQASFRQNNGTTQWAVYSTTTSPNQAVWSDLDLGVYIDAAETTLSQNNGTYRVEFDHKGHLLPPFGRLTLAIQNGGRARRCVFASTLLGALRKAKENSRPDSSGRYCY